MTKAITNAGTDTEVTVAKILNENYDGVFDLNAPDDFTHLVQRIARMIQTNDSQERVQVHIWRTLLPRDRVRKNLIHTAEESADKIGRTFGMRL